MRQIAVIGAGVIGVTSALEVQTKLGKSVTVTIFSDRFSPNTTGDVSAGLWTPYILQDTPMDNIIKWSKETYDYALKLWQDGEAEKAGISLQVMTELLDKPEEQIPEWVSLTLGHCILDANQIAAINRKYRANYCKGVTFTAFILEPQRLLPFLMEQFKKAGGKIIQRKINSFDELSSYDVIVNCTGLEAKQLTDDKLLQPVRGQIMRVEAPGQFHCIMEPETYIIPNMDCVILGGTHQENSWDLNVSKSDADGIAQRCRQFSPSLESSKLIKHMVGLRPGRSSVILSTEIRTLRDGKRIPIVHNYGHGGSGVTLSIGCATSARKLVEDALIGNFQNKISKL